ncbi:hypothetical protein [Colwellia sp. Bg11-12]|uniref:hypothetical protein n=1 Tax=Colwellia sp. Bg11-12 TaxID=2759817 RepID=UPI0015F3F767|nr:hypothetical protein [Colwellia sp. Bg11-12]MBA6264632.1 hypothetical protein [Colwellia sp. Bg11-12]
MLKFFIVLTTLALTACGGSSESSSSAAAQPPVAQPPVAQPPKISLTSLTKAFKSSETVSIKGSATSPSGEALTILWAQTSGQSVELITPNSIDVSFIVPEKIDNNLVTLEMLVTDALGLTDRKSIDVEIYSDLVVEQPENVRFNDIDFSLTVEGGSNIATSFTSTDDSIISVDTNGLVSVMYVGEATIAIEQAQNGLIPALSKNINVVVNKEQLVPITVTNLNLYYGDIEAVIDIANENPAEYKIETANPYIVRKPTSNNVMNNSSSLSVSIQGEGDTTVQLTKLETETAEESITNVEVMVNFADFNEPRNTAPISTHDVNGLQMRYEQGDTIEYKYSARLINTTTDREQCGTYWNDVIELDSLNRPYSFEDKEYCVQPGEQIDLPSGTFTITQKNESNSDISWEKTPVQNLPFSQAFINTRWATCQWSNSRETYIAYLNNLAFYSGNFTCGFMYHNEPLMFRAQSEDNSSYSLITSTFSDLLPVSYLESNDDGEEVNVRAKRTTLSSHRINYNTATDEVRSESKDSCEVWHNPEIGPVKIICNDSDKGSYIDERRGHPIIELRIDIVGVTAN